MTSSETREKKSQYSKPIAKKVSFCYEEQVVASNGGNHSCPGVRGDNYLTCRDNEVWND